MRIKNSIFLTSADKKKNYPDISLPEIAFVGKSNVGKSSLINTLLNKKIAKTSSSPGKTRLINFFKINEDLLFVDLPGFGYAKVSQNIKKNWAKMMEEYFLSSENLRSIFFLIDIRRKITEDEKNLISWFQELNKKIVFIITKSDKLSYSKKKEAHKYFYKNLEAKEKDVILFSSKNKEGKDLILNKIEEVY